MRDDRLYLIHINECIERVITYSAEGGKAAFISSTLIQDAVLKNLQTLAEVRPELLLKSFSSDNLPRLLQKHCENFKRLARQPDLHPVIGTSSVYPFVFSTRSCHPGSEHLPEELRGDDRGSLNDGSQRLLQQRLPPSSPPLEKGGRSNARRSFTRLFPCHHQLIQA